MSGYLEVKYPFKSNLGLNPFKSWKRQWCILRPSPTSSGGSLAVYCSEAGAAAGCVELPSGCMVKRTKSRTRPYAFAVFPVDDRKPRVLLAAQSLHEAQSWMEKIRTLLNGDKLLGMATLLKDSYSVTVIPTELSYKCGVNGDGIVTLSSNGLIFKRAQQLGTFIEWKNITDIDMCTEDKNRTCILTVNSELSGGGSLRLTSPLARSLCAALRGAGARCPAPSPSPAPAPAPAPAPRPLSSSDSDLRPDTHLEDRRSSWYSGPSEISLDDIDLVMAKDSGHIPSGQLSRCARAPDLAPRRPRLRSAPSDAHSTPAHSAPAHSTPAHSTPAHSTPAHSTPAHSTPAHSTQTAHSADDSMSDRRSLLSIASGIYEEIPDLPEQTPDTYCAMGRDVPDGPLKAALGLEEPALRPAAPALKPAAPALRPAAPALRSEGPALRLEEPTYESVADCVYATMRRTGKRYPPPPLPPRVPFGSSKLVSWENCACGAGAGVTRHGSLGELPAPPPSPPPPPPPPPPAPGPHARALSLPHHRTFSVFRKRLKSDSRVASSPKSDTSKENKSVETKKKKFDFTPTRDIFKNFKVSRKMKNLKIATGGLTKGETKSCEFLDETEHVTANRCSKSVECLEDQFLDEFDGDLSIEFNDAVAALAFPQEIVDLILRGREQLSNIRLKEAQTESEYIPMTPLVPPAPLEHHYMVMSPKTNIATTN